VKSAKTVIVLQCDEEALSAYITSNTFDPMDCNNMISIKSRDACPVFDVYGLFNTLQQNKYAFGILLINISGFICFFGTWMLKATTIVSSSMLVVIFSLWFVLSDASLKIENWLFWVVILASAGVGLILGFILNKYQRFSKIILGNVLGFTVGMFLYNLFVKYITFSEVMLFWFTMLACIVSFTIIMVYYGEKLMVICTSIIGAYGLVRGLSLMAGGFPDERQVYELGQKGEYEQMNGLLTPVVFGYLAGFVVLVLAGWYVQTNFIKNEEEKVKKEINREETTSYIRDGDDTPLIN
jgi:hypothetical protein